MNSPLPPERVPTLTEVVAWPDEPVPVGTAAPPPAPGDASMSPPVAEAGSLSEEQLTQRILNDLQRQMDLMLDYRLREILTPLLTRAADSIVREARSELASTLRDVVTRAVAQELTRHRTR
ncbi:MAG TPA: hypothetical protein VIP10_07095 [Burkholderiaceae bacterium]